ncbi:hypothetical protein LguiA_033923 [Lonicera macranthoides]
MNDHHHHRLQMRYSLSLPTLSLFSIVNIVILLFSLLLLGINTKLATAFNLTSLTFEQALSPLFSDFNIVRSSDDKTVRLLLNRHSGSGFISSDYYNYGFFSANIKLPSDYTAGIVVAFYTSNVDTFAKTHDELDIEFLGNVKGKPWRFQTNIYGNGSTYRGREERYRLWFDPSKEFHRYSILWTPNNIIFYVDEVPIREVIRNDEMGGDYPSKPMSLYATIWDASTWATNGGRNKVNYKFEPFVSEFSDFVLEGCPIDPLQQVYTTTSSCTEATASLLAADYATITPRQRKAMQWFRENHMYYTHCYDRVRYPVPLPECVEILSEKRRFRDSGRLREKMRFGGSHRRSGHRRNGTARRHKSVTSGPDLYSQQADI